MKNGKRKTNKKTKDLLIEILKICIILDNVNFFYL